MVSLLLESTFCNIFPCAVELSKNSQKSTIVSAYIGSTWIAEKIRSSSLNITSSKVSSHIYRRNSYTRDFIFCVYVLLVHNILSSRNFVFNFRFFSSCKLWAMRIAFKEEEEEEEEEEKAKRKATSCIETT